jgi:hypothetical protein
MLRLLGFFEELGSGEHYRGSIRDAVRARPDPSEGRVIEYLRDGHVLLDVPETSTDVLSGVARIVGAPSFLTDGLWLWRLDLPYYVGVYHLLLPQDFLDHLGQREFQVAPMSERELDEVGREAIRLF